MYKDSHIHAKIESNVHIKVFDNNQIVQDKHFRNTSTRLLTQSICDFLSGADSSYVRGVGRPNFVGLGTMGITKQGDTNPSEFEEQFSERNTEVDNRTRPWFESTSLALTDVSGTIVRDASGRNPYLWNPRYGWGTETNPDEPTFEGELCSSPNISEEAEWAEKGWSPIRRLPILRADILSRNPEDVDFGIDGYSSAVVFYIYASPQWINNILEPTQKVLIDGEPTDVPVGPQLSRVAISEFGLYERDITEPGGLTSLLAGFRVPSEADVVYLAKNQTMVLEWRVTVRALMPYEGVVEYTDAMPAGISVQGSAEDETCVQFQSSVIGDDGVSQDVTWELVGRHAVDTTISENGFLTIGDSENADALYVLTTSTTRPDVSTMSVVWRGSDRNQIYNVELSVGNIVNSTIQHTATVNGKGVFSPDVTWLLLGNTSEYTTLSDEGLLTIGSDEKAETLEVIATSVEDERISSTNVVVLGPVILEMDTNPINELSTLEKSIGRIAVSSVASESAATLSLTIDVVGHDIGTAEISIQLSTESSSTVQKINIPVTSATHRPQTIEVPFTVTNSRTRVVITAKGPITITQTIGYIMGTHLQEVEYFDVTTPFDYLIADGTPIFYEGSITKPLLIVGEDSHVACTLADGNELLFEVGIPEGTEYIE